MLLLRLRLRLRLLLLLLLLSERTLQCCGGGFPSHG